MGYNAWKAGLVQAPRGLGSMTSMMMIGQLARTRVDTRKFIGIGFTLVADLAVGDVRLEFAGRHVGGGVAQRDDGTGAGHDFPDRIRGRAIGRRARANGLCLESVQHDAQYRAPRWELPT